MFGVTAYTNQEKLDLQLIALSEPNNWKLYFFTSKWAAKVQFI